MALKPFEFEAFLMIDPILDNTQIIFQIIYRIFYSPGTFQNLNPRLKLKVIHFKFDCLIRKRNKTARIRAMPGRFRLPFKVLWSSNNI